MVTNIDPRRVEAVNLLFSLKEKKKIAVLPRGSPLNKVYNLYFTTLYHLSLHFIQNLFCFFRDQRVYNFF